MSEITRKYNWDDIQYTSGSIAFGYYEEQQSFRRDAIKVARMVVTNLGYPINEVQLFPNHVFSSFEFAIMKYTSIVNQYKIKNHMLDVYGNKVQQGLDYSKTSFHGNFKSLISISQMYGNESIIRSSKNIEIYDTVFDTQPGIQDYNIIDCLPEEHKNQDIQLMTVYHHPQRLTSPYFNPLIYPGFNMANIMTEFGGAYASNVRFMIMPLFETGMLMQAIKMDQMIRKSHFGFELIKNRIRLYPTPKFEMDIRIDYILSQDKFKRAIRDDTVNNISNFPIYQHIPYDKINIPGKNWIYRYTLANCKGILGTIRSKYGGIPYTQGQVTLDGDTLRSESQAEKDKLIQELKLILQQSSIYHLMQKKRQMSDNVNVILQRVPSPIIIK